MDAKTRRRFVEELPKVYRQVLAQAVFIARKTGCDVVGEAAEDLVQEAVLRTLSGDRNWDPERVPDLRWFLVQVIRSIASSYRKRGARRGSEFTEDIEPIPRGHLGLGANPSPKPDEESQWRQAVEELETELFEAAGDDEDLLKIVEEFFDGAEKPNDIAESLGWPPEKVYTTCRKLRRRLFKKGFKGGGK